MFYQTILRVACVLAISFLGLYANAQTKTITGQVVDDSTGEAVVGVTIKVKNGPQSAVSNTQGAFTMNIPAGGAVLQYSHIGYEYGELKVDPSDPSTVKISVKKLENKLDEVVVIGYGSQKSRDVTGSVASVDLSKLPDMPVASVTEALKGQIPGLNVQGGSTRPGTLPTLSVRQQFNWGKDGGGIIPLIVIDDIIQVDPQTGLPSLDRFNMLDLSEVESITVLRDASAAIYGSRASQGAVIVKTKRGKLGTPRISYNGKFERNDAISHSKVMNARQYGEFVNRFGSALGWNENNLYSDAELASMDSLNYDWLKNDWRAANAMQHSVDVNGGGERATYFTGVSYYTQSPNLGSQDFKRWTYRAGTDIRVLNGLRLGATIAAASTDVEKSFTKINFSDGYAVGGEQNDYSVLLHMPKYIPWVYNINGIDQYISPPLSSRTLGNASGNNSLSNWNYYALLNNGSKTTNKNFNYNANFSLQYDVPFIRGLAFKVTYGISQVATNTEQVMMPQLLYQAGQITAAGKHLFAETPATDWKSTLNKANSRVTYDNTTSKSEQSNFFVTYDRKFGNHSLSAMGSVEKTVNGWEDRYQIYDNPVPGVYNGTSVSAGTLNASNTITYRSESGSLSYLGRMNYNYKSKYLLQFVFRSDASTVFAPKNYWGFFPGVSAGWVVSDENWFKSSVSWINYLKIRASLGRTGNNNIKAWKWLQLYSAAMDKGFGFGSNGGLYVTGLTPEVTPNPDVKWDRTLQRNVGLDMAFLNRRLSLTFDQYYNSSTDMLTAMAGAINVPISVGGAFAEQNYSSVNAWGTELSLNWKDNIKDFTYSVGMNFGMGNYKTIKYFDQPFDYPNQMTNRTAVGNYGVVPVWGYKVWKGTSSGDGIMRTDEDINNYWAYLTDHANNSGIAGAAPKYFDIVDKSQIKKGMLAYEDVRGALDANSKTYGAPNGTIEKGTGQDLVKLKNSNRSYTVNTNLNLGWKGVSLLAQIVTSWGGANFLDYVKQGTSSTNALWSQPIYFTDMYDSASNPNGRYPSLAYADQNGVTSDFYQLPTFRMFVRSLSIGYSLPKTWIKRAKIENARVYLSGMNLWDFYNPYPQKFRNMYDAANVGYPTLRTWALGINLGF